MTSETKTSEFAARLRASVPERMERRDFLRVLGAGAAMVASAPLAATTARADNETTDEKRKSRYRESADVKAFYRVNRYPASR